MGVDRECYHRVQAEAENGCAMAQTLLGHWHLTANKLDDEPIDLDRAKAKNYLEKAACQRNPLAAYALAEYHSTRADYGTQVNKLDIVITHR